MPQEDQPAGAEPSEELVELRLQLKATTYEQLRLLAPTTFRTVDELVEQAVQREIDRWDHPKPDGAMERVRLALAKRAPEDVPDYADADAEFEKRIWSQAVDPATRRRDRSDPKT